MGVVVVAAATSLAVTLAWVGLLTFEAAGYWGNAVIQGIGFAVAGIVASRIAGTGGTVAVVIGVGLTSGLIGIVTAISSAVDDGPIRSSIIIVLYVFIAIAGARWFSRHSEHRSG